MSTLVFWAQFIDTGVGATLAGGDIPTVDVDRIELATGTRTALVNAGAAIDGVRRGLWGYRLTDADLATYSYVATFVTANTSVDQSEIAALGMVIPDVLPSTLATAANLATVDTNVDAILADTGTDGVVVATASVSAIATAVWAATTRTLSSFGTLVATIWAYATRTLTQSAASVTAAVRGSDVTILRGDLVTIPLVGLGSLASRTKLWFTVKGNRDDDDTASIIQVEETGGLLYLNGAATTTTNATLVVDDEAAGDITITLKSAATAVLVPGNYEYDVQQLTASGALTEAEGYCEVKGDITKAIS